jgi:hypothetical protein
MRIKSFQAIFWFPGDKTSLDPEAGWVLGFFDNDGTTYESITFDSRNMAKSHAEPNMPLLWGRITEPGIMEVHTDEEFNTLLFIIME